MTKRSNFSGKIRESTTCASNVVNLGEMLEVVDDSLVINLCAQNVLNSYWHLSLIVQSFEVYLEL